MGRVYGAVGWCGGIGDGWKGGVLRTGVGVDAMHPVGGRRHPRARNPSS